jgi:hypothetical protein
MWGPLLVRSVVTTSEVPPAASISAAALCSAFTDVAHACTTMGPETWGAPTPAATVDGA